MMTDLIKSQNWIRIFEHETFGKVRAVMRGGEPWFVAKDVANALGYSSTNMTQVFHAVPEEWKGSKRIATPGGTQQLLCISEQGLYFFLARSDKPAALPFQKWLAGGVLPVLRKHGVVGSNDAIITRIMTDYGFVADIVTTLHTLAEKAQEAERKVAILSHVNKTYTATEMAKELGFQSAIVFNKFLAGEKVQFKVNGTWELYADYSGLGLVEIKQEVLDNGRVIYHRRWTQLGREWLLERYGDNRGPSPLKDVVPLPITTQDNVKQF